MILAKSCGITLVCAATSLQVGSSDKSLLRLDAFENLV